MNAIFYHEDNCFLDYDVGNLLRKNNFFTQSVTGIGNLISSIMIQKPKLVLIKSNNQNIVDIINEKYLKETLFNGVDFVFIDVDKAVELTYKKEFYKKLEVVIEEINKKSCDDFQIFNLDKYLIDFGFLPKYRGFTLLKDCIKYSLFLNQYKKYPMLQIYGKVAEKHNTTAKNVERLVRLMILQSLSKANLKELSKRTGIHEAIFRTMPTTNCMVEIISGYIESCL